MFYRMKNIPLEEVRQNEWIRKNQGPKVGQSVVDLVEKMEDEVAVGEFVNKMVVNPLHSKHSLSANDYLVSWKNIFFFICNFVFFPECSQKSGKNNENLFGRRFFISR